MSLLQAEKEFRFIKGKVEGIQQKDDKKKIVDWGGNPHTIVLSALQSRIKFLKTGGIGCYHVTLDNGYEGIEEDDYEGYLLNKQDKMYKFCESLFKEKRYLLKSDKVVVKKK